MANCPLTLRITKGSKLTFAELDGNFISLANCINNLPQYDSFVTGGTYNTITNSIDFTGNFDFVPFSTDLSYLANTDITVTGGTYDSSTGVVTFYNNSGGTFQVSGFLTGYTNYYTTGVTLNNTTLEFDRTDLSNAYSVDLSSLKFTGNTSGDCINDLYISNIHSCSPLNINPNNEGNVYFGSTSAITVDLINNRFGIGTSSPQYPLQILGTNSTFYYDPTSAGGRFNLSGSTRLPRYDVSITSYLTRPPTGGSVGMRSWNDVLSPGYGNVGDMHIYAGNETYGLNIINGPGTNTEDYIRFYAGQTANGTTPDIHIQGSGVTRGNIGVGTGSPSEKLDVNGKIKTTNFQMTSGATNGYVLTSDSLGNASWQQTSNGGISIDSYYTQPSNSIITWDVSGNSTNYQTTLTANTTLNLTNVRNGDYGTIILTQDSIGSKTITFGAVNGSSSTHMVSNGGGGSPVLTSTANAIDILTFTYNGSIMFWTVGNDYT